MNSQGLQPVLSPLQMKDFAVSPPATPLKPVDTKLLQAILLNSNAHSVIVITGTKLKTGKPACLEMAHVHIGEIDALTSIEKTIEVLINMRENLNKHKQ